MTSTHQHQSASPEELHAWAVESSARGRPAAAVRLIRRALPLADTPVLRAKLLLSLAHALAEQGSVSQGLAMLDAAAQASDAESELAGLIHGQRGLLQLRMGQVSSALSELQVAVRLLKSNSLDSARALMNLGVAQMTLGDLRGARTTLSRAAAAAESAGATVTAGKARHNLAYLDFLRGDLTEALRGYESAAQSMPGEEVVLAILSLDTALTLLAAGLLGEADAVLASAIPVLHRHRLRQDEAQAWLNRAEVALADQRYADAAAHARIAMRTFRQRQSVVGPLVAEGIVLVAEGVSRRRAASVCAKAVRLSAELDAVHLRDEGRRVRLHVAHALHGAGLDEAAADVAADALDIQPSDAVRTRMLAHTVRAELAGAKGDRTTRRSEIHAGLTALQRHQSRLGSVDLQTSVMRHGEDLARMGLADAVASGRPTTVLRWLERTRALATRLPAVHPPEDPAMADLLESLRHQRLELRQLELDPDSDETASAELRRSCRELERAAAARERQLVGSGNVVAEVSPGQLRAALLVTPTEAGALVSIFDLDERLHALVLTPGRAMMVGLGPLEPVVARLRRVRADLDVLALSSTPPMMRSVVMSSLRASLDALDQALWRPLAAATGQGPLALVPTGALATLPWTLLPGLRGRPITVARAPGAWLRGRSRAWPRVGDENPSRRVVFTTGPRVDRAEEEVTSAAAAWHGADVLALPDPAKFLAAASVATLLHVAAHGSHDADNPLFSSIELAGGLVFGHDLVRVHPMPRHIVLSACDLGLSTVRSGGETLGMTAALLHGGAGSVVAGVARVADDIACDVAVAYHQRLAAGDQPSYALAGALADTGADGSGDQLAPLTCFGAGW